METVSMGFVKNNPWVQIDRAKRVMVKESEKSTKTNSPDEYSNKFISNDAEFSSRNSNFDTSEIDGELEYGPGFVQKLKNRYLQLVASTAAVEPVEVVTSKRKKYKAYGRRTASCDDLMSDGPVSPRRELGPLKSQSTLNVFRSRTLVPATQTVSIEPPPNVSPPIPLVSDAVTLQPSYVEPSFVHEVTTQPVSMLKGIFEPVKKQKSSVVYSSSVDEVKGINSKSDNVDENGESVPEFVKMSKKLKHVGSATIADEKLAEVSSVPSYPSERPSSPDLVPIVPYVEQVQQEDNFLPYENSSDSINKTKNTPNESVSKTIALSFESEQASIDEPKVDLVDSSLKSRILNQTKEYLNIIGSRLNSRTTQIPNENDPRPSETSSVQQKKVLIDEMNVESEDISNTYQNLNQTKENSINFIAKTKDLNKIASKSAETEKILIDQRNVDVDDHSMTRGRSLKPTTEKEQRMPSPVPSLSEMKELLQKFQEQRKNREENEPKNEVESTTATKIKSKSAAIKDEENLLKFDIYDGLEKNFIEEPSKAPISKPRASLSTQFKMQNQHEKVEKNGNSIDNGNISLIDQDINSVQSSVDVLQPITLSETDKLDSSPSSLKNGFHTVATYNPSSSAYRSKVVNGYGVINGDDPFDDDDDDDDVDALLMEDNDDDKGRVFEFEGANVIPKKSSIAGSTHKAKPAVEFRDDSPRAYAYVEEMDAEELGKWQEGTELNYKEYKDMCDRLRQDKFRKSYNIPTNQEKDRISTNFDEEIEKFTNSGHLANFTPSHLKSADYNLGSASTQSEQPTVTKNGPPVEEPLMGASEVNGDTNGSYFADNSIDLLF